MKKILFLSLLVFGIILVPSTKAATINVPADFPTIQAAIDAAAPGDKIEVAAGTYVEQVVINKNLTLSGTDNPMIKAPASPTGYKFPEGGTSTWEPIVFAFGGTADGSFNITGTGQVTVSISGITVDGNARIPSPTSRRAVGILYRNAVGDVTHCTVQNMGYSPSFGNSWGIMAYGTSDATFHGNIVSGYAKGGFVVNGYPADPSIPKPHAVIDGNTVTGPPYDPALALAPNGIQIGWGATGSVTNNTVTHHGSPGTIWGGTGILIQSSPNVLAEGNRVTDNQDYGIATAGYESYGGSYTTGTIIRNNTVGRNGMGIYISRRSVDTLVQNNTITGNEIGIRVGSSDPYLAVPPVNTDIHNNMIYGNTDFGAFVETNALQEEVDATNNWWGDCSGPSPYGTGNAVTGNINVMPFECITKNPVAMLTATPKAGFVPLTVTFDGSLSYPVEPETTIIDWIWNLGDGSPDEYGIVLQHIYNSAGFYTVTLTVKDSYGKWGSTQGNIKAYNIGDLTIDFYSERNSLKANGKESTFLFAHIYDAEGIVLEDLKLIFGLDNGTLVEPVSFDPSTGTYQQQVFSGTPGAGTAQAILGGTSMASLQLQYLWPQSPINAKLEIKKNHSLLKGVLYAYLNWQLNPNQPYPISWYKVYRSYNSGAYLLLIMVPEGIFSFEDPGLPFGDYKYAISGMDNAGDESEWIIVQ
jgi:parallel beta-helix repeat protein